MQITTQIEEYHKVSKGELRCDLGKLYAQFQDTREEKRGEIYCGNKIQGQWKNIKKCLLDTVSELVGKVERNAGEPWITQEMISKMDERRKQKSFNNKERKTTKD